MTRHCACIGRSQLTRRCWRAQLANSTIDMYNVHCTLYIDSTNNISFRQKTVTWRLQIISGSYFHFMGQDAQDYNKLKYHFDIVKWTMYILNYMYYTAFDVSLINHFCKSVRLSLLIYCIMNLNFPQKTDWKQTYMYKFKLGCSQTGQLIPSRGGKLLE